MKRKFIYSLKRVLLLFTVLQSGFAKDYGDPRWNHGVLTGEEIIRIKGLLKDINFLLRDRSNNEWIALKRDDPIPESAWVKGGDVKMIIHGFAIKGKLSPKSNSTHKVLQTVEEKLEEQNIWELGLAYANSNSSINVFIVDWLVLSTETLGRYFEASESTRYVGEELTQFLVRLAKESYITDWDNVHVIGFSLGGHTAGVVGAKVQELVGFKVGRITGIDPAGPNFDNDGEPISDFYRVLDKSDGKFVDVIHCNMIDPKKSILGRMSTIVQSGHADFYPDGGESQSLCTKKADRSTKPCSHMLCCRYMAQSVSNPMLACPCENWNKYKAGKCNCTLETGGVYMGDHCDTKASGKYYVQVKK